MLPTSNNNLLTLLARHVVGLSYFDRSPERAGDNNGVGYFAMLTGFIVSIRGVWHWVTAGHIIEDLETAMMNGQRLEQFEWHDSFGQGAKDNHTVKTIFPDLPKLGIFDSGMDYGIVKLTPNIASHFKANAIEAMDESYYEAVWPDTFDKYMLLGFPSQLNGKLRPVDPTHVYVDRSLALLNVEKIDEPPAILNGKYPRFYGKVSLIETPLDGKAVTHIDGMSGGLISGFKKDQQGNTVYCLYALQSEWDEETRSIAACPIQPFLQLFGKRIDDLISEYGQTSAG